MAILDDLATAEQHLAELVEGIEPAVLANPTPCDGWDVGALLAHTLASAQLFASAIDGLAPPDAAAMGGDAADVGDPAAAAEATIQRSQRAWASLTDLDQVLATPFGRRTRPQPTMVSEVLDPIPPSRRTL